MSDTTESSSTVMTLQQAREEREMELLDMPEHVKQAIVDFVGVYDKVTKVRFVSKEFKMYVDSSYLLYRNVTFYVQWGRVTVYTTMPCGRFTHLTFHSSGRPELTTLPPLLNKKSVDVPDGKYVAAAVDHVMELVNNKKIVFQGFMVSLATGEENIKRQAMDLLSTALEKSDRWLQVKAFTIEFADNEAEVVRLLANVKPKFLKFLYFTGKFTPHLSGLRSPITQTDQWKLAREVDAKGIDMTGAYCNYKHLIQCKLVVQVIDMSLYDSILNHFRENPQVKMQEFHCIRERTAAEEAELTEYIMNNEYTDDAGYVEFPNVPGYLKVIIKQFFVKIERYL